MVLGHLTCTVPTYACSVNAWAGWVAKQIRSASAIYQVWHCGSCGCDGCARCRWTERWTWQSPPNRWRRPCGRMRHGEPRVDRPAPVCAMCLQLHHAPWHLACKNGVERASSACPGGPERRYGLDLIRGRMCLLRAARVPTRGSVIDTEQRVSRWERRLRNSIRFRKG